MGLQTEPNQHLCKEGRQTEEQPKSLDNGTTTQHLCTQRKFSSMPHQRHSRRQFIEDEKKNQKQEKNKVSCMSGQNQEVSKKESQRSRYLLNKLYEDFDDDETEKYEKADEKESEKEGDNKIKERHLEQENVMVIKRPQFDKKEDLNELPIKHVNENLRNKLTLKQQKDQENLHQMKNSLKGSDLNNNLKDAKAKSGNTWTTGEDLQSVQIDNKEAYDSVNYPEKHQREEETHVKMLSGGDEHEDGDGVEKSHWELDSAGRCDSMDSLGFKTKLHIVSALFAVQRDPNRLQKDVEKRFNTTVPGVVSPAVSHKDMGMLCDLHEKEIKPIGSEAKADICRMEGEDMESFGVPSLLPGEISPVPLHVKQGRSIRNSLTMAVCEKLKEDLIEKHEVDVLEHDQEKFIEQLEKPKVMILVEELVCLWEKMRTYMSSVEEKMEKSPIHILGLTDGRQHYDNSSRGHSSSGKSQSGSPPKNTAAGGDHKGSDRGEKKKKDSKEDEGRPDGESKTNPEVNSPTVRLLDTQVPPFDYKSYRRKHGSLSFHEFTMYLGYLGNLQVPSQEEAPPWQLLLGVNSCLEMVVDSLDPILDEALSCRICVTLVSHLKHFADCLSPYTSSCLTCRQIFMLICVHVKTCIDMTASLSQRKQQSQQQLAQNCAVSLCQKITSFVLGDVEKLYKTLSHIWPRIKKTLSGLLRDEEVWDPQSTEFPFPVKMPSAGEPLKSCIRPGRASITLPSIPEHGPLTDSSSYTSFTREVFSNPVLAQSREGEEHDEEEESTYQHQALKGNVSDDEDPNLGMGTAGIGNNSFEPSQSSVSDSSSSSFTGRVYVEEGPSSLPNVHVQKPSSGQLFSLIDRPMGTPGIGEVVYGNKWQLVKVAKFWGDLKLQYQMEGHLARHYREEGVILSEYKKQLQIMKTRYQENFQYEKLVHLGNGMSGKCHLAQDWNTEYKFCLKKIHISHYEEKEIEIWSELEFAYIVKLYGAIRLGEMVFILAEFIDGGCLTEAINTQRDLNCRLGHRLALHYFKQILQVLCYLKNKDILHEDLKADNILLIKNDRSIRVADFGLARKITHPKRGEQPFGTQTQWSPEKAGSEGHGFPSEVWAAVCVLVHMLSGYPPWVRRFPDAKMLHFVIVENSPPIQDIPKKINPVVQDLIVQGLEPDTGKRPTAEALLKHKAFTLYESGPPSDQIYSTLLTSSSAAMLPPNHLDENTSILQEIYNSLAMSQVVNVKGNIQHRSSLVSLPSQPQRPTSQKGEGPEHGLYSQSAEMSSHLDWLTIWYTPPQIPPDLVAMPVFVNPGHGPLYPPENQVPSLHYYDYLYDHTSAQPPVPDNPELEEYIPDDIACSESSYQSYNLSDEDVNSNLPKFGLLDVDLELENLKQEMGLLDSGNSNSSLLNQGEIAKIPDPEPDNGHDSFDSFDSFKLFGEGEPPLPTLPKFGDIASFSTGELFMTTDKGYRTEKPNQQCPSTEHTQPVSECNEKTNFDRMTVPEEKSGVSHQIIQGSAKKPKVEQPEDLSSSSSSSDNSGERRNHIEAQNPVSHLSQVNTCCSRKTLDLLPNAKQQESSQNSSKLCVQPVLPKDQQSSMMRRSTHPFIQATKYLYPPTHPHTAPPDQKPAKPFPESAVLLRNSSSHQQLPTKIPPIRVDYQDMAAVSDKLDKQKTSAVTASQNLTSSTSPSQNSLSTRLTSDKSEKDLHNELLKLAASDRDRTNSSRPPLHLDLKRALKITHKDSDRKAPNTAPATMSKQTKEPDEDLMYKSCDERPIDSTSSNTRSTPSPVHTTPKSAYDEQEEAFRILETASQKSDDILNTMLDDETLDQVNEELPTDHDDLASLKYVYNTYLDGNDQSAERSVSLTFVNQEGKRLLIMKVKGQTTQSWHDFIENEFCQDNTCHRTFGLKMFSFQHDDGRFTFVNLDDSIGDQDRTVLVIKATDNDPWFVEDGIIKQS